MTTTADSKGKWHTPRAVKGGDRRTGKGQSMRAQAGMQSTGKSKRSFLPGFSDIYKLSEAQNSNYYEEEEEKLFQENTEIKNLIESLEKLESTDEVKT